MAGSRKAGPIGTNPDGQELNDGTLIRARSPLPGPVGVTGVSSARSDELRSAAPGGLPARRKRSAPAVLQALQRGSRGPQVQKLQRQLNARLTPHPRLVVDGIFGPLTQQAVLRYQKGVAIASDGIAGRQTWYHLLKGDRASGPVVAASPAQLPRVMSPPAPAEGIWEWPLEKKLGAVLERVPGRLPGRARDEFMALIQLQNLALSLAIIAGFCLLSGGTALVLGLVLLGFDITMSLATALQITALAANEDELNEAADEFAHIVLAVSVAVFIKAVGKITKGLREGGTQGSAKASAAPQERASAPAPRPRQPAAPEPAPRAAPQVPEKPKWNLGEHKSARKFQNQMQKRGWTPEQIDEAMSGGKKFPAQNNVNPGNTATRYVHPETGRSVVVDDVTKEVLHVGGDGFKY